MSYPQLNIIIPTYNRPWILKKTIELLRQNLIYSGGIIYYLGIDGDLSTGKMFAGHDDIIIVPGPNNGLGANLNRLINTSRGDFLFQMDDDHHLLQPLELDRHVNELEWNEKAGWIRLMGIAYHDYYARLKGEYWHIYWESPEFYITSDRPHLKHKRFHDHYGLYSENVKLGETEEAFCQQCKDNPDKKYSVLVPLNDARWNHIGESWQLKGK